ncbi:MAG TPA: carboxypeptidase-like regulatory domain-containing protein, partial [Nitrososphaera sp.]|nr:carboxypeptidase-like regulatory domain-containing protein [Nitrososphaera sp.]
MNLKNLLLLVAMLMLSGRPAAAQPGCPSTFDAFEVCNRYYLDSEYVLFGKVLEVKQTESPVEGYGEALKVTVAIEESIKGELDREAELTLVGHCTFYVKKNSKYMFTAKWASRGEVEGLLSRAWSWALDENPPDKIAALLEKINSIVRGEPQPRLFGTVAELDSKFQPYRAARIFYPDQPLPGIVVVAEDKNGKQTRTQTDAEGNYSFGELAFGMYTVYPILPKKMDLYANAVLLKEGEKQHVEIDDRVCGRKVYFAVQETGSVTVTVNREAGHWERKPEISLVRPESGSGEFPSTDFEPRAEIRPSSVRPETGVTTNFEFIFEHVPPGSYFLVYKDEGDLFR